MPACPSYDALLESFADGEIDGPDLASLRGHLDGCAGCRRDLRVRARLKVRVAADAFPPAPEAARREIERSLRPASSRWIGISAGFLGGAAAMAVAWFALLPGARPAPSPSPSTSPVPISRTPVGLLSLLHRQVLAGEIRWPLVEFRTRAETRTYLLPMFGEAPPLADPPDSGWSVTHAGHRGICADCQRRAGPELRKNYIQALDEVFPETTPRTWVMCQAGNLLISCVLVSGSLPLPEGRAVARGSMHTHGDNAILVQRCTGYMILWIAETDEESLEKLLR